MTGLRLSAAGPEAGGAGPGRRMLILADTVLRGVGQVMFQNSSHAGLLFLVGVGFSSLVAGAALLVGTAVATLAAAALGADRELVRAGMFGFNGGLVGIALLHFLEPGVVTWLLVVLASAGSTIVMAAMLAAFDVWRLPVLTAPFLLTSLTVFLATARFGRLQPTAHLPAAGLPHAAAVEGGVTASTVVEGVFVGVAQVFFQGSVLSGVLIAAGLLVASRVAVAAALAGSLAGLLVAWGMGAAESAIRAGAYGFNSVLAAVALAGVFLAAGKASAGYALLAALAAPFVTAACAAALEPLGLPALTLPFVLVTWVFMFASRMFPKVGAAPPSDR